MIERDEAKGMENNSVCTAGWQTCYKLRNPVTKLNKKKNKLYETKLHDIKNNSKNLWSTLNEILGKNANSAPSLIESDSSFIKKPSEIAIFVSDFFIGKISKLGHDIPKTNSEPTPQCVTDQIMKDKHCNFECGRAENRLLSINNDKPRGLTMWMEIY